MHYFLENTNSETNSFQCHMCDFVAKNKSGLDSHIGSHKVCDICSKSFVGRRSTQELNRHKKIHNKVIKNNYECVPCDKTFNDKSVYTRHKQSAKCRKKSM